MAKYFMFGQYSQEAIKGISSDRTSKAVARIKDLGGKVDSMYVLLGKQDLVLIVDFPKMEDVIRASLDITKSTGIAFSTSPAISVDEFDQLV